MQVLGMMNNPHYLYRMTVLVAVAALAPVVSHDVLCNRHAARRRGSGKGQGPRFPTLFVDPAV